MKLQVFDFIDETLRIFNEKRSEINEIANKLEEYFFSFFDGDDKFTNISQRVKSDESLKEKILRQNYFLKYKTAENVVDNMQDLIGIRIECRFIEDESSLYKALFEEFSQSSTDGYYHPTDRPEIQLMIKDKQPQMQHNGFEIYKIDGRYKTDEICYHFELQIKSFVNIFWGDIDHRVLYKNFDYVLTEDFVRQMLYSIKDNLEMVDAQLVAVYNHLNEMEGDDGDITKNQLKKVISKTIHDLFLIKFKANTGIVLDFRKAIDLIVDYLFAKAYYARELTTSEYFISLMEKLNRLSKKEHSFGEFLEIGQIRVLKGEYCQAFGKGIESIMNLDLKWNLILYIIFQLEETKKSDEFVNFIEYIVFTVIYRIRTAVNTFGFDEKLSDELVDGFTKETFAFICESYDVDFFTLKNMRLVQKLVKEIVEDNLGHAFEIHEDDYVEYRKRLAKEADV